MFCEKILDSLVFCGRLIKVAFFVGQILNPRIAFILGRREYRFHLKSKCLKPKVLGGVNRKIFYSRVLEPSQIATLGLYVSWFHPT
jgi:hypothetical protein